MAMYPEAQKQFQTPNVFPQAMDFQQWQPSMQSPQGNVYSLQSPQEVLNLPLIPGLSVGLCLKENLLYIKTLQNGIPNLMTYKISPIENEKDDANKAIQKTISTLCERIEKLEQHFQQSPQKNMSGGGLDWQV